MLRIVVVVLGLLALSFPAGVQAQDQTQDQAQDQPQDRAAIETVIAGQLQAFNARQVEEAWTFASPMIQGIFGSPANFGMMVMQGYPMVWTNTGAEFLELRDLDGRLTQTILLRDAQGGRHVLDYIMIETAEGWKINGVYLVPQPDVGV